MEINSVLIECSTAKEILEYLVKHSISKYSVAKAIGVTPFHIGEVLAGNRPLSESLRTKINTHLGTNY